MPQMPNVSDFVRMIMDKVSPVRMPAEVIGYKNGVLTAAVEGRVTTVEYPGTDELLPGHKVWLRRNPEDPHGSYDYSGLRMQAGSISATPGQMNGSVSQTAIEKHLMFRVRDGNHNITLPARKYLEFRGSVNVTDDPTNDKVIVEIVGYLGLQTDFDDTGVDFDDPDVDFGG